MNRLNEGKKSGDNTSKTPKTIEDEEEGSLHHHYQHHHQTS